jgi:hypothetical protein
LLLNTARLARGETANTHFNVFGLTRLVV